MTQEAFTIELKKALIARGLSESEAIGSVSNITSKLTDESRGAIDSYNIQTVYRIADRIVMLVKGNSVPAHSKYDSDNRHYYADDDAPDEDELIFVRRREQREQEQRRIAANSTNQSKTVPNDNHIHVQRPTSPRESFEYQQQSGISRHLAEKSDTARINAIQLSRHVGSDDISSFNVSDTTPTQRISAIQNNNNNSISEEYAVIRERVVLTPEGKKKYIRTVLLSSPIIAVCAALFFSCFGLFVVTVSVICAAVFAVFVAEIIAGCLLTLFSLIFGIVQLFSAVPIGIYEIGLSFIIAGVSLAISVLTYKLSTGVLPYVIKRVCIGMKNTLYRLSEASEDYKRRCNEE